MFAKIIKSDSKSITVKVEAEITIPIGKGMLEVENFIQSTVI